MPDCRTFPALSLPLSPVKNSMPHASSHSLTNQILSGLRNCSFLCLECLPLTLPSTNLQLILPSCMLPTLEPIEQLPSHKVQLLILFPVNYLSTHLSLGTFSLPLNFFLNKSKELTSSQKGPLSKSYREKWSPVPTTATSCQAVFWKH